MCEKRTMKIKKARLRAARRVQRLQSVSLPPSRVETTPCQTPIDRSLQNRVYLELAWKTIALMQKNRDIQQKIVALQKETSEFVAKVMSNPINRQRYLEHIKFYGLTNPENRRRYFEFVQSHGLSQPGSRERCLQYIKQFDVTPPSTQTSSLEDSSDDLKLKIDA